MTMWSDLAECPFQLGFVDAAGIRTRSLRAGSGEDIVFLHGTSGHLEAFIRNIPAHSAQHRCHVIDMLGHGYTGKPNYPYEIPRYVSHLRDYLDAVDVGRVHLVGESLGGWVAAWFASEDPGRVASLQLIAPGGSVANPAVMQRIKDSTERAVRSSDIAFTRERLALLMYDPENATDELVEIRHRIYHQPDFIGNIGNLLCLQDMEVRKRNLLSADRLTEITAPTLIIWGNENPFGDVPEAVSLHHAIARSRLEIFSHCGHWPQHEHHEQYDKLSLAFLAETGA